MPAAMPRRTNDFSGSVLRCQ